MIDLTKPTPEPVLHEGWVAICPSYPGNTSDFGKVASGEIHNDREGLAKAHPNLIIGRIRWMSDGSPAPGSEETGDISVAEVELELLKFELQKTVNLLDGATLENARLKNKLEDLDKMCLCYQSERDSWKKQCKEWAATATEWAIERDNRKTIPPHAALDSWRMTSGEPKQEINPEDCEAWLEAAKVDQVKSRNTCGRDKPLILHARVVSYTINGSPSIMINPGIHILTEADLEKIKNEWFALGVRRGKFEATATLGDTGMPPDDGEIINLSVDEIAFALLKAELSAAQAELRYAYMVVDSGFRNGGFDFSILRKRAAAALAEKEERGSGHNGEG